MEYYRNSYGGVIVRFKDKLDMPLPHLHVDDIVRIAGKEHRIDNIGIMSDMVSVPVRTLVLNHTRCLKNSQYTATNLYLITSWAAKNPWISVHVVCG